MNPVSDFREYAIDSAPKDWLRWGGTVFLTLPTDALVQGSAYPVRNTWLDHPEAVLCCGQVWTATDGDVANNGALEVLVRFRAQFTSADSVYVLLGAKNDGTTLAVRINQSQCDVISLPAFSFVPTVLASAFRVGIIADAEYWCRFRLQTDTGGHAKASVWLADGQAEPSWQADVTGVGNRVGRAGFSGGFAVGVPVGMRVDFFSVANGGATATASAPETLEEVLKNPHRNLSVTVEVEMADFNGAESTQFFSNMLRQTGGADYPPNITMPAVLNMQGLLEVSLAEDQLFAGLATQTAASLKLSNPLISGSPILDYLAFRTLMGRKITFRVGDAASRSHRAFTTLAVVQAAGEPVSTDTLPNVIEIQLATPIRRLDAELEVARFVGINTAFYGQATTGTAAVYGTDVFSFALRWRGTLSTTRQVFAHGAAWVVTITPGGLVTATIATSGAPVVLTGQAQPVIGNGFHWAMVTALQGNRVALIVDGLQAAEALATSSIATATSANVLGVVASETLFQTMDFRIYTTALSLDDALAAMADVNLEQEESLVGWWKGDDSSGTTVTDYSQTANHATGLTGAFGPSDEGTADLAGKAKPQVFGMIENGPAIHVDPLRDRYVVADRNGVDGVQDTKMTVLAKGVVVTPTTSGAVIAFSGAQTDPVMFSQSQVDTGGPPEGAPNRRFVDYLATILSRCGGIQATAVGQTASCDGGGTFPFNVGNIIADSAKASKLVDDLVTPLGASIYYSPEGTVTPVSLTPPCGPGPYGDAVPILELLPSDEYSIVVDDLHDPGFNVSFWLKPFSTLGNTVDFDNRAGGTLGIEQFILGNAIRFRTYGSQDGGSIVLPGSPVTPPSMRYNGWYFVNIYAEPGPNRTTVYVLRAGQGPFPSYDYAVQTSGFTHQLVNGETGYYVLKIGGSGFHGAICDLAIWGGQLSYNDIAALMAQRPGVATVGVGGTPLNAYFPLADGTDSTTVLEKISGRRYTVRNARWAPRKFLRLADQGKAQAAWRRLRPAWSVKTTYRQNFAPISNADIGATVTEAERVRLRAQNRTASVMDPKLRDRPDARPIDLGKSLLSDQGHARAVVQRMKERFKDGSEIAEVTNGFRDLATMRPNDEVWLSMNRHGLAAGAPFRVVKNSIDWASMRVGLALWGLGDRFVPATGFDRIIDDVSGDSGLIDDTTGDHGLVG